MTEGYILYKSDYKYQLVEDYKIKVSIKPEFDIETDFIVLDIYGNLTIRKGYSWDGPSGPVIDTDKNLRGALVHDALYQLMRMSLLHYDGHLEPYRKLADLEFQSICKEDGVHPIRAFIWYRGLRRFAAFAADPKNKKVVLCAPLIKKI
jgi:hypothetical protein